MRRRCLSRSSSHSHGGTKEWTFYIVIHFRYKFCSENVVASGMKTFRFIANIFKVIGVKKERKDHRGKKGGLRSPWPPTRTHSKVMFVSESYSDVKLPNIFTTVIIYYEIQIFKIFLIKARWMYPYPPPSSVPILYDLSNNNNNNNNNIIIIIIILL
jgi:hypothetical protein